MDSHSQRMIIALVLTLPLMSCCIGAEQKAKIQELRQLASETPISPDFEQIGYSEISKPENTVIAYFYRSSASYAEVKSFYSTNLLSRGWSVAEEPLGFDQDGSHRLVFKKGLYTIDVEYGDGAAWRVAVDYSWNAK